MRGNFRRSDLLVGVAAIPAPSLATVGVEITGEQPGNSAANTTRYLSGAPIVAIATCHERRAVRPQCCQR